MNICLWCLTPIVALSRTVMPKHAMQMLATGRLYDAQFALRVGLVNDVVEPERLAETVIALAAEIASKSTYTLALGKQAFYRQLQMPISPRGSVKIPRVKRPLKPLPGRQCQTNNHHVLPRGWRNLTDLTRRDLK